MKYIITITIILLNFGCSNNKKVKGNENKKKKVIENTVMTEYVNVYMGFDLFTFKGVGEKKHPDSFPFITTDEPESNDLVKVTVHVSKTDQQFLYFKKHGKYLYSLVKSNRKRKNKYVYELSLFNPSEKVYYRFSYSDNPLVNILEPGYLVSRNRKRDNTIMHASVSEFKVKLDILNELEKVESEYLNMANVCREKVQLDLGNNDVSRYKDSLCTGFVASDRPLSSTKPAWIKVDSNNINSNEQELLPFQYHQVLNGEIITNTFGFIQLTFESNYWIDLLDPNN